MDYLGVAPCRTMSLGIMLDGDDPLGGVTSWAQDLAGAAGWRLVGLVMRKEAGAVGHSGSIDLERFDEVIELSWPVQTALAEIECSLHRLADFADALARIRGRIQILIPNYFEYGYKLAAAAIYQGHPLRVLGFCHTDEPYYYHLIYKYRALLAAVVAVNSAIFRNLARDLSLMPIPLLLLPYGVPLPNCACPSKRNADFSVLYVGRLVERQKKVSRLAEVAHELARMGVSADWRVIGDGDEREQLVGRMPAATRFLGALPRPGVFDEMLRADALILVSEAEGTPIVMLEAMACGMAVVAPDLAGCSDVLRHGETGLLYPEGETLCAVSCLAQLARSPHWRAAISQRAWFDCRAHFGLDAYRARFGELLRLAGESTIPGVSAARQALGARTRMRWANTPSVYDDVGMGPSEGKLPIYDLNARSARC